MRADGDGGSEQGPQARHPVRRFLPLAVILAGMALALAFGLHRYLTFEQLLARRVELRHYVDGNLAASLVLYILGYALVVALSLPGGLVLTIFGGFLFGWLIGGLAALVAATTGAFIVFLAARTSFGEAPAVKAGPFLQRLSAGFRRDAVAYMLFLRLVPVFPFWLVNIAPALLGVPFATYALTTVIGIVPGTFAFAFAGAGLDGAIAAQQEAYDACIAAAREACTLTLSKKTLINKHIFIAVAALGFVALLPPLMRRLFARRLQGLDKGSDKGLDANGPVP
ncbi:TVP38/TMEM64 family protein [Chelatococcus composti]|jgi:Uncharacterized conserved protein|uniref:TVP38/TMEM64 family membrane protein n=1 Tax=Chelatococcus composti TaxID=1743235 RepID=A0A841K5K7_9HYPH|nr:TVP38/TMEM64 family protein [Chelatococcus composti]MBB6167585.1 putative membrane protein YdjX (TVP38/TMEM64 family) [Chelatococcus composti]MBS7735788.1 TVP38/TMEM64 family protein [Chelatococcus composti]PZN40072.1 MAG: TVP38/TMEM64 family protein [Pseudomonadota bacterium]GGG32969.1 TVP38/TMEM64 family protein [Chelatococcus composti]